MKMVQTRRRFLTTLSLAGAAGLIRPLRVVAADGPPETTAIRLAKIRNPCIAPQYVAEELLRAEGFTEIRYVDATITAEAIGRNEVDFSFDFAASFVTAIDAGAPITLLAGGMVGCVEVFAKEGVHGVADLKGKSVGVRYLGTTAHWLVTIMAAHVGLDPVKDIRWVTTESANPLELFVDGKIDALLGSPPESLDLRARHIGHVILNTALDRPWSQYFCCLLGGNREYVRKYPAATKRVLRAFLKASDLCATEPERAARSMVDRRLTERYDYALQTLRENGYDKWREYDAEDTIRFYALRMHEAGFIKSSPQKIIADGTDWRFLTELKRELKT